MEQRFVILSLFPGIGLLDHAFELEWPDAAIVRGPDVLWGGDVRRFHVPPGRFDGVIGGPPCQAFSSYRHINPYAGQKHGNLIPEYERVVGEAQPLWFLMENVPAAPEPVVDGYWVHSFLFNNRWTGAEQNRRRRFSFGSRDGRRLSVEVAALEAPLVAQAVTNDARAVPVKIGGSGKVKKTRLTPQTVSTEPGPSLRQAGLRLTVADMCLLQGLPADFADELPFSSDDKRKVIANGVPIPTGRAIARAARRALGLPLVESEAAS